MVLLNHSVRHCESIQNSGILKHIANAPNCNNNSNESSALSRYLTYPPHRMVALQPKVNEIQTRYVPGVVRNRRRVQCGCHWLHSKPLRILGSVANLTKTPLLRQQITMSLLIPRCRVLSSQGHDNDI